MRIHVTISEFRRCRGGMRALVQIETEHGQDISSPSPRFMMPWHYEEQVDAFKAPDSVVRYLSRMFDNVKPEHSERGEGCTIHQTYTGDIKPRIAASGWIEEGAAACIN